VSEDRLFVNYQKKILIRCTVKREDKQQLNYLEFLYDLDSGHILNQVESIQLAENIKFKKKSNINLVKSDMGHLDLEEDQLNVPDINLELNYGKNFLKINDLILKRLNTENDKGIILLHGDPGTGKTSYIKYLTNKIEDKEILFIPPSMAETLSEPSIIPFLMEHKNSILIIEDAERVISDRETNGSSAGVSNILNLTDGILGDCLSIQIIATFNMRREKIDSALLRKGRLIAEHKFTALSVEETNKLLKSLGKKYISEEEMCLADIYNIDVEQYRPDTKNNKIGF
jgi:SpoVK/Ycf46/Vps4 family AAA+-type ATPase